MVRKKKEYKVEHSDRRFGYAIKLKGAWNFLTTRSFTGTEIVWTDDYNAVRIFSDIKMAELEATVYRNKGCDCEIVAVNFEKMVEINS